MEGLEPQVTAGAQKLLESGLIENVEFEYVPRPQVPVEQRHAMIRILHEAGYRLWRHGTWMGPHNPVTKMYEDYKELAEDLENRVYGENILFRKGQLWDIPVPGLTPTILHPKILGGGDGGSIDQANPK